jgi:signal transduction histidine kinase
MVNDLLNQAQLEAGKLKLNIHPFEPAGLVEQIQSKMQLLAEPKGLTLITTIDPDLPSPILGDAIRLQQILVNLISNGIKFTESGSVQVILTRHDQNYWAIHVVDTGSGIPKEVHHHIFEPFGQVDGSITRKYGGTGLGLSIVKQLTVLMGGQIQLESNLGQGSHFLVILPLLPTDQIEHLA